MAARGPKPIPLEIRFWAKVAVAGPDDCWPWQGGADKKGYGRIGVGSLGIDRRTELSHRVAWFLTFGEWPELCVLHSCDTPGCCNPGHLFLGTVQDNNADMRAKGRQSVGEHHSPFVRGEANAMSVLDDDAVRAIRGASGTLKQIAEKFGVHFTTVSDVRRRKSWRHVQEAA